MASINQTPSHVAKLGYNGFDMSNLLKFSSTTGELLPVYYDLLSPGDKVSCQTTLKTRTMEIESAAMVSLKEHLEWFFVPMTQIYSIFGDWFNSIQDLKSSLVDPTLLGAKLPYWDSNAASLAFSSLQKANDKYFVSRVEADPSQTAFSGIPLVGTSFRLFELLGIPVRDYAGALNGGSNGYTFPMGITPIFACAYQKIYFDFYRLSDREVNDPSYYNLDAFYSSNSIRETYGKFFTLRYRPWAKDFFTNRFVSPLIGSKDIGSYNYQTSDTNNALTNAFNQWLSGTKVATYTNDIAYPNSPTASQVAPTQIAPYTVNTNQSIVTALSPTSIRTSFAVQKLLEITRRSGKHYDAQTLAHFGVNVPTGIAGEVMYLGGSVSNINIGDVIATAGTESSPLGQVGGKGYGYDSSKPIKFTAPCHGILMCIYSCEPKADYAVEGLDRLHTYIDNAAWYHPEFDNLGMQPMFSYQQYLDVEQNGINTANFDVIGWQYRWSELKTKYNRVVGAMSRSLSYWTPFRNIGGSGSGLEGYINPVSDYLISPCYLDDIMLVKYQFNAYRDLDNAEDGKPWFGFKQLFNADPLIHELYFDVKKSAKMSTYGLEQL